MKVTATVVIRKNMSAGEIANEFAQIPSGAKVKTQYTTSPGRGRYDQIQPEYPSTSITFEWDLAPAQPLPNVTSWRDQ